MANIAEASDLNRGFRLLSFTPGCYVLTLLCVEAFLCLSERYQWFAFNHHKGNAFFIVVASVGVFLISTLLVLLAHKIKGRPAQVSLRSVLLFVVAISIPCSWFAAEKKKGERSREAVQGINESGGYVYYVSDCTVPIPGWLRRMLGEDLFGHVQVIDYAGSRITDDDMKYLRRLDRFDMLTLCGTHVSDAGLANINGSSHLESLSLTRTRVTDAGLRQLAGLPLRELSLDGTSVTDAGLETLSGLTQLEYLNLSDTKVTSQGVTGIRKALPNCRIDY